VRRFHAHPYYTLLNVLDSHNVGRGRGGVEKALAGIKARTLVVGITSDYLFATHEQVALAGMIPGAVTAKLIRCMVMMVSLWNLKKLPGQLMIFIRFNNSQNANTVRIGMFGYGCVGRGFTMYC